jgi:prevent-host-death family protein
MKATSVNVAEAKQHLSDLLGRVAYGREIIALTRRGKPMAKLVPVGLEDNKSHIADAQGWLEEDDAYFKAIAEIVADRPKPLFIDQWRRYPAEAFYTSTICAMELRHGSSRRPDKESFWERIEREILARVTIQPPPPPTDSKCTGGKLARLGKHRGATESQERPWTPAYA